MAGAGKKVIAYIPDKEDPELMYKMYKRGQTPFVPMRRNKSAGTAE